jgi:LysM repeat protein
MPIKQNIQDLAESARPNSHRLSYVGVVTLVAIPFVTQAFFGSLFPETVNPVPQVLDVSVHAADMPLLSALNKPVSEVARGGGDIVVQDSTLIASGIVGENDMSPMGNNEIRVYTVREGDSLSQVAEMFGVTTNTILWANDLPRATQIQPDDVLVILPIAGVQHTVKSGDTISTIAKKYDGDADEILAFNQLTDTSGLGIGDEIIIPGGTVQSVQARAATARPVKISGATGASSAGFIHPAPGSRRTQGIHGNNAVDFAAGPGTTIRSAAAGEVIVSKSSGWNGGYGQYIVVRHNNGTQTLYAHLSQNYVGVGGYVAQGEAVGAMGNTGRSTGTHLHFEVRGARNPF